MKFLKNVNVALKMPRGLKDLQMKLMRDTVRQEFVALIQDCKREIEDQEVRDSIDRDVMDLAKIMTDRQQILVNRENSERGDPP